MANKPRQKDTKTTYLFCDYVVTIENLKNGSSGQPRHRAFITNLQDLEKWGSSGAFTYEFTGHYLNERGEALWILKQHIFNYWVDQINFAEIYKKYDSIK